MSPRKKAPRKLDEAALPPWSFVTFTDLHVSTQTLDRALDVLGARVFERSRVLG